MLRIIDGSNGNLLIGPMVLPTTGGADNAGMNVHRSSLSRCLYEYARHLGVEVEFNTRVVAYFEDVEKGGCLSKAGEKFEADVVIAADGIGSHSSDIVKNDGEYNDVESSGYSVFRCTYPIGIQLLFIWHCETDLQNRGSLQDAQR